jgi:hypothetical protein
MTRGNSRSVAAHAFLTLTLTCAALLALASGASADTVIVIDAPSNGPTLRQPFGITGWAIETSATANTGIDAVHVWAFPTDGAPAKFVGDAGFGPRPDVAAAYGSQYGNAGYGLTVRGLKPGEYKFAVYPHSSITGTWGTGRTTDRTRPRHRTYRAA